MSDLWETAAACGICGSGDWRPEREICGRRFVACHACATVRLLDRVAEDRLDLLYSHAYATGESSAVPLETQLANPTFAFRQRRLDAAIDGRAKRLFEVGCGDGNFLAFLRREGWTVSGSEFDTTAAAAARRHGLELHSLADVSSSRSPAFDVVAAYHVLEHIYAPREWLEMVTRILAPSGLLHLQVPNYASLTRRASGEAWASWVFPQHVYMYTPATLSLLLRRAGFTVASVTTWDPWHGPGTVAASAVNTIARLRGRGSPWTAELSKAKSAACVRESTAPRRLARHALNAASEVVARAESVAGRGAVVDILATPG